MLAAPPRVLSRAEKLDWLRLIQSEHVGPITFSRLLQRFGSARVALDRLPELARRGGSKAIKIGPLDVAEREMAGLDKLGAHLVGLGEPGYPVALATLEDAPPLLRVFGQIPILDRSMVAMVGARNASLNGQRLAQALAAELGRAGLVVVSGLARGIDTNAHRGALDTGTVAVAAGGVDVIYPPENAPLHAEIAARGAVVSEIETGTVPQSRHFPRRNRLISGMALGVVVVEASPKSGSLITARFALDQGREVFAVPGSPLDPRARGANDLIRQGATLVETADDVLRVLTPLLHRTVAEPKALDFGASQADPTGETEVEKTRSKIHELLGPTPVAVDEIIRIGQFSPPMIALVLLELELAGRLERHPGNQVSLIVDA